MSELDKNKQITFSQFDYETLTLEQRTLVVQRTGEIRERLQRSAQDIWEIGQRLADVRAQLKHGQFDSWLKEEFGWSRRTAYNFINVYETFGERANLAQIDIATSALYLLAAPSTPQDVREQYLLKAKEGEKITHKELRSQINQKKQKNEQLEPSSQTSEPQFSLTSPAPNPIPSIVQVVPQPIVDVESVAVSEGELEQSNSSQLTVEAGWYILEGQQLVFCGDTASLEFRDQIADVSLAVAATSSNWDHDWLVDAAQTLIVLQESALAQNYLENLITMFSQPGETIVFPWLPYSNMIAIANKLNRKVIAGDNSAQRCQQAILASGLEFTSVQW